MILCSLIEELCTKEENDKTGCNFNFGHECINVLIIIQLIQRRFWQTDFERKMYF